MHFLSLVASFNAKHTKQGSILLQKSEILAVFFTKNFERAVKSTYCEVYIVK